MANLSGTYANVNGTIYNKQTGQGYSNPQQFFSAAGVNNFNHTFDTTWRPQAAAPVAPRGNPSPITVGTAQNNQTISVPQPPASNGLPVVSNPYGMGPNANVNLQANVPGSLQGTSPNLQGSYNPQGFVGPTLQGNKVTTPPTYNQTNSSLGSFGGGNNDVSSMYANVGGTIYNKNTGQAFSTPQQFFADSGLSSFNGVNFDTAWNPSMAGSGAAGGYGGGMYGAVNEASGPVNLNAQTPSNATDSNSLTGDTGYSDIMKLLSNNLSNMDKLFSNMSQYANVSPEEKAQQAKVAADQAAMEGLGYQAKGLWNPDNQAIALPFLTGQAMNKMVGAGIQSTLDQSVLNYMQGNRQFAFNSASTIFDASRNNLQTMLDVYSKAAPQNLSTNYNPTTGEVNAIMRNPLTGAQYVANLGNIGAQKQFTSVNIATNPLTNEMTFVGTTSDGKVVTQPIGSSFSSGGVQNPLQGGGGALGNFTQTGNPQVSNAGTLLGNWVNGGTSSPASGGYQSTVYQAVSKATGQQINASTPASQLVANIPALAQGIATAEGWNNPNSSQHRLNNPGNIIWANQPNATPSVVQTSSGPRTFAKFNTLQDGWNAMYTLLGRKLGATPTPTPAGAQASVQNLPYALQSAVKRLSDGTPYFDTNQITASQIPMAQAYATQTGIHYVNPDDASKLNNINVTTQNLSELKSFADSKLYNAPGLLNGILNTAGSVLGGSTATQFNSMRQVAINSIQSLAGGAGSGLRINQGEIAQAVSNLPTIWDSKGQADTKLNVLNGLLNKWTSQIIPGWNPPAGGGTQTAGNNLNYTQILNNLIMGSSALAGNPGALTNIRL